jgi:hypothetical protein
MIMIIRALAVLVLAIGFAPMVGSAERLTKEEIDRRATEVPFGNPESEADYPRWLQQKKYEETQKRARDEKEKFFSCFRACRDAEDAVSGCNSTDNCYMRERARSCLATCRAQ